MSDQQVKIVKKKVKPYPIEGTIEKDAVKSQVEVIFVNVQGAIIRLKNQILHVGAYYQIVFEIPVTHEFVNTQVRVLKTYDKTLDIKSKSVERVAELHFQDLTKEHRARIFAFVNAIGQESK